MGQRSTVVVRPGVGMLALFPSMNYKPWYAMSEFIDNALQSWRAHADQLKDLHGGSFKLIVAVDFNREDGTITVSDNAAGIAERDVARAFTPATPPADRSGLSQFGIGMKSAGCWYASRFSVETAAIGEPVSRKVTFDVPAIIESGADTVEVVDEPKSVDKHGTILRLESLNHPIPTGRTLGKIRDFLRSIYREYLRDDDVELYVADVRLRTIEPAILNVPRWDDPEGASRLWRKRIHIKLESGKEISGWAGIRARGKVSEAGLALLYRGKVVQGAGAAIGEAGDAYKPRIVFGDGNSFASQRIVGELDVSAMRVTHSKDSILWDEDEEEEFLDAMRFQMDSEPLPLLRMANNHRRTERGKAINGTIEKAISAVVSAVEASRLPMIGSAESAGDERQVGPSQEAHESPELVGETTSDAMTYLLLGDSLRISVVDVPSDSRWLRVYSDGDGYVASMNRSHRFTESFADLPNMDIEPVLRLAAAIAIAEIRAKASGLTHPRFFVHQVNELLAGPLSERT